VSGDDIVKQLSYFVTNEVRMPAGLTLTVIEEIERLEAEVVHLRTLLNSYSIVREGITLNWNDDKYGNWGHFREVDEALLQEVSQYRMITYKGEPWT
jgi:hypothetical protein